MKKQLLTIISAVAVSVAMAQTPSPSWQTVQNTSYTMASGYCKFLDVVNSNVVWGIGGSGQLATAGNYNNFTRTINGGATFSTGIVYPDTNTYAVANLEGIDANTAWVSAYEKVGQNKGAIHKTTNGGATWVNMTAAGMYTNTLSFCNIITFVTPSVGITMGDPVGGEFEIWRTTDAGTTWTLIPGASIPNPVSGEYGTTNIYEKQGTTNIWFGTNRGRMFRSTNAGLTWSVSQLNSTPFTTAQVSDIAFTSATQGLASVVNGTTLQLFNTFDGGITWTQIPTISANFGNNDFCAVPGTSVFVSCANTPTATNSGLSYSSDGGVTWNSFGSNGIGYVTIDFADANSGWSSSFQNPSNLQGIYKYNGPTSIFNLSNNTVCLTGSSATISTTNMSLGGGTYNWSASSGVALSAPTGTNTTITFTSTGTYSINLLSNNGFTTNLSSQIVNVIGCSAPIASYNASTLTANNCNSSSITLSNTTSGSGPFSYTWSVMPSGPTFTPNAIATSPTLNLSGATAQNYTITLLALNSYTSNTTSKTLTVSICVGIAENNLLASNVKLFPNPTKDIVTVSLPHNGNEFNVTITDILGSVIYTQKSKINSDLQINLANKAKGVYFITIQGNNEKATKKIILE